MEIFRFYAMSYTGTRNNVDQISIPSVELRGSNEYGGHLCMSLYTGKKTHSNDWVELPIITML